MVPIIQKALISTLPRKRLLAYYWSKSIYGWNSTTIEAMILLAGLFLTIIILFYFIFIIL